MNLKSCQVTGGQTPTDKLHAAVQESNAQVKTFEKKTQGPAYRNILAGCQLPSLLNKARSGFSSQDLSRQ